MPTLHTTTLPPQYIGEATIELPVKNYTFKIALRFTVFGELLEYYCPEMELPETAREMIFNSKQLYGIKAELNFLPYRLMLLAQAKKSGNISAW